MVNRRSVIKLGAVTIAGALVNVSGRALGAAPSYSGTSLYRAVFDERFEEGLAFAAELNRRGVMTSVVGGDVGKLWYGDLQVRLRQGPAPIAGLTDRATLFCLEELARGAGMSVFYRVDHLIDRSGHTQHDAVGPASIIEATRRLVAESEFGRAMAVLASHFEVSGRRDTAAQKRTGPFSPQDKTALVSWVIA